MLSQRGGEVLTMELQLRVLHAWAQFPWWGAPRLWQHLHSQGARISLRQVRQVARESGWSTLRQRLGQVYAITADSFRPQDEWLVCQLLPQVQTLTEQLLALGGLALEQQVNLADLQAVHLPRLAAGTR
jgi:hypothetical protein